MNNDNSHENIQALFAKVVQKHPDELDTSNNPVKSGVYLFFSFDLANSTAFKTEHPALWAEVFTMFYTQILEVLGVNNYLDKGQTQTNKCKGVRKLWKLIGDEVLIYVEINRLEEMYYQVLEISNNIENILPTIADKIQHSNSTSKLYCCEHCQNIKQIITSTLGIKATGWIAECYESSSYGNANIIYKILTPEAIGTTYDFIGRDIDEGFRISKLAAKNKLIISPMLGWLIWKWGEKNSDDSKIVDSNFKITSFINLKGVWKNRKVPIIMFNQKFLNFSEILEYDELDIETFSNIKEVGFDNFLNDKRYKIKRLDIILKNVNRIEECDDIYHKLDSKEPRDLLTLAYTPEREFHIACVLLTSDNKVLLHHDGERGYEFGCAKYKLWIEQDDWKKVCEVGYKTKYNMVIKANSSPIPIATYTFIKEKHHTKIPSFGLIVIAEFDESSNDLEKLIDWKLYTREEALTIEGNMVNDFRENLKRAFSIADNFNINSTIIKGDVESGP